MSAKILRILRIILSVSVFIALALGLTSSSLLIPGIGPWLEKLQIGQALVTFSLAIFIGWLLVTLIFGRIYCSTLCPLGTLQDAAARTVRMRPLRKFGTLKRRYRYTRPLTALRYTVLFLTIACLMAGLVALPSLLDPYSVFNRFCANLLHPLVMEVRAQAIGSQASAHIVAASIGATAVAAVLFIIVLLLSVRSGRIACSTICPVGTALGCVSRFSIYQMDIDPDLCTQCGLCEDVCKAQCIDLKDHLVDGSRCVVCFDCAAVCPASAIRYTRNRKQLATPLMQRLVGFDRQPETSMECGSDNFETKTPEK